MISLNYSILLEVELFHEYFADRRARDLSFVLSHRTASTLRSFGMIWRQDQNKLTVLLNDEMKDDLIDHMKENGDLVIEMWLDATSPLFTSYTAWSGSKLSGHLFVLDNASGIPRLHEGEHLQDEALRPLASLTDAPLMKQVRQPVAYITLTADQKIIEQAGSEPAKYNLSFDSRKTLWKYFVTNRKGIVVNDLAITNKKLRNDDVFSGPQQIKLPNGDEAAVFTSPDVLSLHEKPPVIFQLKKNYSPELKNGEVLLENLPAPSPQRLSYDKATNVFTSEMYVHL